MNHEEKWLNKKYYKIRGSCHRRSNISLRIIRSRGESENREREHTLNCGILTRNISRDYKYFIWIIYYTLYSQVCCSSLIFIEIFFKFRKFWFIFKFSTVWKCISVKICLNFHVNFIFLEKKKIPLKIELSILIQTFFFFISKFFI